MTFTSDTDLLNFLEKTIDTYTFINKEYIDNLGAWIREQRGKYISEPRMPIYPASWLDDGEDQLKEDIIERIAHAGHITAFSGKDTWDKLCEKNRNQHRAIAQKRLEAFKRVGLNVSIKKGKSNG